MQEPRMMRRVMSSMVIGLLIGTGTAMAFPHQDKHRVNCNLPRQTITRALKTAQPGETIEIRGTCTESVLITTDRITLDGGGHAVIMGQGGGQAGDISSGLVDIAGARGVTLMGLTIRNSPIDGITGRQGAALTLRNITVEDSGDDGIEITENTSVDLAEVVVRRSGEFGMVFTRNSYAEFNGNVGSYNNQNSGIVIPGASNASVRSGSVEAANNQLDGIIISDNASISTRGDNITLTTHDNGRDGMLLFVG